ncbi:preprotein translocase subunit SecG [Sphingomonas bacterium]|uniref:preprotein translocase subunit SecG n=1 Tax=Sphingomonas bacterium TaxID=1895847 RepID=UPI00157692FE|nr:preprotein translocase subunit SecG [Sphingomonas bacterium]
MFTFLLVVHAIIAASLVTVILLQKSEGGGLGMGGSPSGLMSARGAADFLTRATTVLATAFVGFSILLAVLASSRHAAGPIDTSLARRPAAPVATQPATPVTTQPAQPVTTQPQPAEPTAPFSANANIAAPSATPQDGGRQGNGSDVPLAH